MSKNIRHKIAISSIRAFLRRIITRNGDATAYLLSSPANAERLLKGLEDYERGLACERSPIEE